MRPLHVEPLHFARFGVEPSQRDARDRCAVVARNEQAPRGRRVVARQLRDLAIESLEAEVDAERLLVFEEQRADGLDVLRPCGVLDCRRSGHPREE